MPTQIKPITHNPAPLRTGRVITVAMHQIAPGDVLAWNGHWLLVQVVDRNTDVTPWREVVAHCVPLPGEHTHGSTCCGGQNNTVAIVPRAWVDHSRLPVVSS